MCEIKRSAIIMIIIIIIIIIMGFTVTSDQVAAGSTASVLC